VVEADPVAVVVALGLSRTQPDLAARAGEVPDRLAPLTFDLADPVEAERAEQVAVEGQAALDRGDDEIDVVDAGGTHVP
jgi:hypothetical protein